jgi:hypothetical protein
MEDGIEPTHEAVLKVDRQISELAEILVEYYFYKRTRLETLKNARLGLVAKLRELLHIKGVRFQIHY